MPIMVSCSTSSASATLPVTASATENIIRDMESYTTERASRSPFEIATMASSQMIFTLLWVISPPPFTLYNNRKNEKWTLLEKNLKQSGKRRHPQMPSFSITLRAEASAFGSAFVPRHPGSCSPSARSCRGPPVPPAWDPWESVPADRNRTSRQSPRCGSHQRP